METKAHEIIQLHVERQMMPFQFCPEEKKKGALQALFSILLS
jgi:hypothetical protein